MRESARATNTGVTASGPRGGRPRDPAADETILQATRRQLVKQGYARMTVADVAADAGVTRPTIYRRWPDKLTLVSDALNYGFVNQRAAYNWADDEKTPFERFRELVRRTDPCFADPNGLVLEADLMAETNRTPELLRLLAERAVEPRTAPLEALLTQLKEDGAIRPDTDERTTATMILGAFFGAHLRTDRTDRTDRTVADQIATEAWAGLRYSTKP
jgi:AcrR family transcriptional regulator